MLQRLALTSPRRLSRDGLQPCLLEALLHITGLERGLHLIEAPLHEQIEIEQRQTNSMIGDPILWEIVGANLFSASARSDETAAMGGIFLGLFLLFLFQQTGPENCQ